MVQSSYENIFYSNVELSKILYKTFNSVGVRNKVFLTDPSFEVKGSILNEKSATLFELGKLDIKGEFDFKASGFTTNQTGISFDSDSTNIPVDGRRIPGQIKNSLISVIDLNFAGKNYNEIADTFHNENMRFSDTGKSVAANLSQRFIDMITKKRFNILQSPKNFSSEIKQSFFFFDFSSGDFKLESGDVVENATINLKILSHFGERTISSGIVQGASSLFGPLRINPRVFQVIRITKEFDRTLCNGEVDNPETRFENGGNYFDSYFGTAGADVDENVLSEFTISKPMKKGETLKINITEHLQDAIDNRSGKLRFAIRPKMELYSRQASFSGQQKNLDPDQGGSGVGNHYFEFERGVREDEQPRISVNLRLKADSTGLRRARFQRTKKVQL